MTPRASKHVAGGRNGPTPPSIAFDDAALVAGSRKGDMQAFASLVVKYQHRVFNTIYRMCSDRSAAEELAQETFLKALERIRQFRGASSFYTWLFRIAVNLTLTHRRRSARIKFHSIGDGGELAGTQAGALSAMMKAGGDPSPLAAAISKETRQCVLEALEELDEEFRVVVVLRDIEDMDYSTIAHVLDVPVGTVKSRLCRARHALRDKLAGRIG